MAPPRSSNRRSTTASTSRRVSNPGPAPVPPQPNQVAASNFDANDDNVNSDTQETNPPESTAPSNMTHSTPRAANNTIGAAFNKFLKVNNVAPSAGTPELVSRSVNELPSTPNLLRMFCTDAAKISPGSNPFIRGTDPEIEAKALDLMNLSDTRFPSLFSNQIPQTVAWQFFTSSLLKQTRREKAELQVLVSKLRNQVRQLKKSVETSLQTAEMFKFQQKCKDILKGAKSAGRNLCKSIVHACGFLSSTVRPTPPPPLSLRIPASPSSSNTRIPPILKMFTTSASITQPSKRTLTPS